MITEPTVLLSAWFRHATYGINAMIDTIDRNKPGGGKYTRPVNVTIYDDCTDESVEMDLDPDKVPAVVVFCDNEIRFDPHIKDPSGSGMVGTGQRMAATYIVRETGAIKARQDGGIVLRAIAKSLYRFNFPRFRTPKDHVLNGISISKVEEVVIQRVAGSVGKSTLAGFVLARLLILDKAP